MKEGKYRAVPSQYKQDEFNFDCSDSDVVVVHYDIETHVRNSVSSYKLHTPYIVGFVDNVNHQFRYFTGENCIEQFIRRVLTYTKYGKVYVNVFNGAKFDHYELVKRLKRMYKAEMDDEEKEKLKLDQLIMHNGSILKASIGEIECFDISKHITGTLRESRRVEVFY